MNTSNTTIIDHPTSSYISSSKSTTRASKTSDGFSEALTESVVEQFKRRHPDHARHVDQQVKAGKSVRDKNGVSDISTKDMTMEEYQAYFYALLETIPYDSTRVNDTTVISISDKGWEQMRKDPDYEAWILGYFVEDRAVHNPFFGWGNNEGNMIYERFGTSIEEHNGMSFSKAALKGNQSDDDDEEDWWVKRHKRMKKLMREQVERQMKKDQLAQSAAREEYAKQQYKSSLKQHNFLTTGSSKIPAGTMPEEPSPAMATAVYGSILDLFSSGMGTATL